MTYLPDLFSNIYFLATFSGVIAFLYYILSERHKWFIGYSGILFIGIILAYQALDFLVLNETVTSAYTAPNAPIMVMAILAFPKLDSLKVFIVRKRQKRSLFKADRNHIHHPLSVMKEIESNGSLQKTIQPSTDIKEGSTANNDLPTISLQEKAGRVAKERHALRRREIAKKYAEEFKKITTLQ